MAHTQGIVCTSPVHETSWHMASSIRLGMDYTTRNTLTNGVINSNTAWTVPVQFTKTRWHMASPVLPETQRDGKHIKKHIHLFSRAITTTSFTKGYNTVAFAAPYLPGGAFKALRTAALAALSLPDRIFRGTSSCAPAEPQRDVLRNLILRCIIYIT